MVCLGETRLNLDTKSKSSKFQFAVDRHDDTAIIQYPGQRRYSGHLNGFVPGEVIAALVRF